jgi:pyridoxamine 5'-phosphate oxidase
MTPRVTAAELPTRLWQELQRAPRDKHHDWRTPVLATVDPQGRPQARTVVLRHADRAAQTLVFFTDARSPKCAELRAQPHAALLFWSPHLNWQLRAGVRARVIADGPEVDAAWARVKSSPAAGDYLSARPPGDALVDEEAAAGGGHHLAVVQLAVQTMDWLELARAGHRRAAISSERVEWRVP